MGEVTPVRLFSRTVRFIGLSPPGVQPKSEIFASRENLMHGNGISHALTPFCLPISRMDHVLLTEGIPYGHLSCPAQ